MHSRLRAAQVVPWRHAYSNRLLVGDHAHGPPAAVEETVAPFEYLVGPRHAGLRELHREDRKPFRLPKLGGGGEPFGRMRCFTKRFALGQYSQTVAQAAVEARSFFANVEEIEEVNIRVSRIAIQVMADSSDKWRPQTHETADHSMPYAAGVALMYGTIEEQHYEDPYLHDKRLMDLVSRVRCLPSDEADRVEREMNLCDLEVVLKSGRRKNVRVEYHRGHWKNPMTDAEVEEKFRTLARRQLPAAQTDNLLRQLWALESLPQAGALIAATRV